MTVVDRPDNGQDEGAIEPGRSLQSNARRLQWFIDAELVAEVARRASGRAGAGEQQRERVARWLFDQRMPARYWDNPSFELERDAARKMADELLALLGGPQPDGEVEPCPVYSHGTDGWHCAVTGAHEQHTNAAGDVSW